MLDLEQIEGGVIVPVRAHAGAPTEFNRWRSRGSAASCCYCGAERGKANQAIVALLSKAIGVSKSAIEILSGETSPQKRLLVRNIEIEQLRQTISTIIAGCEQ